MHRINARALRPVSSIPALPVFTAALFALTCAGCGDRAATAPGPTGHRSEIRRGLGSDPETLDPRKAADNASLAVVADLYEGLTTEAADGRIVPGAAESFNVTRDGLTWTFHLRSGLKWSNGAALESRHFATALQSVISPGSTAPNASTLDGVGDVAVPDNLTLQIRLARPMPYLPAVLALPVAAPAYDGASAVVRAVVNGPYQVVEWRQGQYVQLARNEHYRAAATLPIARVRYLTVGDLGTELNLYRTGALDLTSEVPNAMLPWIRSHMPAELHIAPYLNTYAYAVNTTRIPGADARRALSMAIDRERITTQVTGAGERPAYEWVAPGLPGYGGAHYVWAGLAATQRAAAALQLWRDAAARQPAPTQLKLCTDASANHRRTAVALADQWRATLGVRVEIVELEWNTYLATLQRPADCDLVRLGWSADYADPEAFAAIFASNHPQNTFGYRSARYDALLAQSRTEPDPDRRMQLLSDAEATLLEDAPVIPVFHRVAKRLVKREVVGDFSNPLGHLASRDLAFR